MVNRAEGLVYGGANKASVQKIIEEIIPPQCLDCGPKSAAARLPAEYLAIQEAKGIISHEEVVDLTLGGLYRCAIANSCPKPWPGDVETLTQELVSA